MRKTMDDFDDCLLIESHEFPWIKKIIFIVIFIQSMHTELKLFR